MKKLFLITLVILGGTFNLMSQCLSSSLDISTGLDPLTNNRTTNGLDPKWRIVNANVNANLASPPLAALTLPSAAFFCNPQPIYPSPGFVAPAPNHGFISYHNNPNAILNSTADASVTFQRDFEMCTEDNIIINVRISRDNYITNLLIDNLPFGANDIPVASPGQTSNYVRAINLGPGLHTISITLNNRFAAALGAAGINPSSLLVEGSLTSTNLSLVQEGQECQNYVCNSCEDPCSWSKTGNDNINSGHFIGTRNNADLNFRTNNSLNMKLGVSGHLTLNEGKSLMFGKITGNSTNNRWGIEEFDGGLNFWKPWPTPNSGNYNMFLSNDGKVGIGIGNTALWAKSLAWNWHKLQIRGWGLADGWATFSDENLKSNFRPIESPLNTLLKVKTYQYDYETDKFSSDYPKEDKKFSNNPININKDGMQNRYGFKAQEVEKILPDLVHKPLDKSGYRAMDYMGFVPIIIEATKELNAKVEKQNNAVVENDKLKAKIAVMEAKFALLEKTITQLCESGCEGLKKPGSSSDVDVLYQSIPNPTDSEALINYHLSREYRDASITVSSQDGKQLMSVKLDTKKGAGSIKLGLGELANGTYLYTLVAGERVIDTKRLQIIK
jgi:hypothetical protein